MDETRLKPKEGLVSERMVRGKDAHLLSVMNWGYRYSSQSAHIDARRISNICAFLLFLFFLAGYLAVAGLNLLAQLSDTIRHFTVRFNPY